LEILSRLVDSFRRQQFAKLISAELKKAGEPLTFRFDAHEFRLVSKGSEGFQVNLGNTFREYQVAAEAERKAILSRFIRSWIEGRKGVPEEFEDAAYDLLPGIRNRTSFELVKLQLQAQGEREFHWPYVPIADHYGAGLVYDLPHAMSQINGEQLARWGVSFTDAMEIALANLRKLSEQGLEPLAPGVWRSPWHDNYDAARVLLTDLIQAHDVVGEPVVMIPNRDTLLLTGSDDPTGLASVLEAAEEALQLPRPIYPMPIRLEYGVWTPYLPEVDHPSHARLKQLLLTARGQDYGEQRLLLDGIYKTSGENVFVASYSVVQEKATGRFASYCMWARGMDSLLPKTDLVHLFDPAKPKGQCIAASGTWEQVSDAVGGLLELAAFYPERFRVRSFPSEHQLEAIRARGKPFGDETPRA
jgi:hypothetical protein